MASERASSNLLTIQAIVGIVFGVINGIGFLITFVVAAKQESRVSSEVAVLHRIWKRFVKYKAIYVTAVIHCTDVITDYLIYAVLKG